MYQEVKTILQALENAGYKAYLVGGCVRDRLMGQVPNDYDVTTNALPAEIRDVFSDCRVIETGLKHGTVTVLMQNGSYEITTFRKDGKYSDGRHPDAVSFTGDLREDLSRRDFTINAMACDLTGRIVDPFDGKKDLEERTIRCVGDPERRFSEDALRILRALRFSSTLGFSIEPETAKAALRLKERLDLISKERCYAEIKKLLCGKNVFEVLTNYWEILAQILPGLSAMRGYDQRNKRHVYPLDVHTAYTVAALPQKPDLRLAGLFHDMGKPETRTFDSEGAAHYNGHAARSAERAEEAMRSLKADKSTTDTVVFLVKHHDEPAQTDKTQVVRKIRRYGANRYEKLLELRRADVLSQGPGIQGQSSYENCKRWMREILQEHPCFTVGDLALDGDDLLSEGFLRGPLIGKLLSGCLEAVFLGIVPNEKQALLQYAKSLAAKEESADHS